MARTTTTKRRTVQTTRINGAKVRLIIGTDGKITIKPSPVEEWLLQAAAVRALKAMPEYAATADKVAENTARGLPSFTIAGDMNGDYRSKRAAVKAQATGIAAGDPDLRVYLPDGALRLIEYKNAEGRPTDSQRIRHPLLASIGHPVVTLKVGTEDEAAARTVELITGWIEETVKKIA